MNANQILVVLLSLLAGIGAGAGIVVIWNRMLGDKKRNEAKKEADRVIHRAKSNALRIERESKGKGRDFENRARRNVENDIRKQKQKLKNQEAQLIEKSSRLDKDYQRKDENVKGTLKGLEEKKERLIIAENRIKDSEKRVEEEISKLREKLEVMAGMSREQALDELKLALEEQANKESEDALAEIEKVADKEAVEKARFILAKTIARFASEVATERTVSIVPLSSDEMKGKIIGREGRNIRTLEAACGVDLIVDETPEAVVISCFDPVRREIARRTLLKLMEDGRVHPARIEEVVSKVKSELFSLMREDGEKAALDLGLANINSNILNLLGSLQFRKTGTQNLLKHSIEVAEIAGLLAEEIGGDVLAAKRAGLLHDIGLAVEHTVEGSHSKVGADFARKHRERRHICHAIEAHEGEVEARSLLAHLVQAANNFSRTRPGVKGNMMESYVRRLGDMESIGNSFDGVLRTFAIQSGKEIRVLVDTGKVTDGQASMLSRDIARKVERELNYPGQIQVKVLRETRIVEHAR